MVIRQALSVIAFGYVFSAVERKVLAWSKRHNKLHLVSKWEYMENLCHSQAPRPHPHTVGIILSGAVT